MTSPNQFIIYIFLTLYAPILAGARRKALKEHFRRLVKNGMLERSGRDGWVALGQAAPFS